MAKRIVDMDEVYEICTVREGLRCKDCMFQKECQIYKIFTQEKPKDNQWIHTYHVNLAIDETKGYHELRYRVRSPYKFNLKGELKNGNSEERNEESSI